MTETKAGARVVLVHGKKPTPHSIVWGVLARLRAQGAHIQTWQDAPDLSRAVFARADLVILRSVHPATAELARAGAPAGATWCNPPRATAVVADRVETWRRLNVAGLPVPSAQVVHDPRTVAAIAADGPVVVKTPLGSRGEGVAVLDRGDGWPVGGRGPWLVQDWVPGDGWDRKLFVIGPHVHGTLRHWPARSPTEKLGRPLHLDDGLAALALAAGGVFGLCAYGVDVIDGPDGPQIVDVNAFPGFKGVPGAVSLLSGHLLGHLEGGAQPCAY
ncbi:RimK family alpha-L-glutamate ligase [Actinomadura sp. 6N118]|uniref:RimK family alpha-L-glutamate ligase n=1 Tax=Actinomadura sp. 6N118 TaxID=3375151 RepID=UPI0037975C9C